MADKFDELYNAKKLALDNARLSNLGEFDKLETTTNDNYKDGNQKLVQERNGVDVSVAQNLQRLREQAAAKGWLNGGEGLQMQLNANTDRSNGLGRVTMAQSTLDRDRINSLNDIKQKRSTYEQTYNNDLAKIKSEIAAQRMAEAEAMARERAAQAARAASRAAAQRASTQQYSNTVYKNDNQKSMYDYSMGKTNKDPWGERMKKLYQAAEDTELSPEDRAFANGQGQAVRLGNYYDAMYENYMKRR